MAWNPISGIALEETSRDLSVVVPCYNEAPVLPELHRRLSAACGNVAHDYELIFVNDGSADATWSALLSLSAQDPNVFCVNLSRNHGHQLALTAGLSLCRGERIFILDADLQDPPELLPQMMSALDDGADVAYGQRERREGESAFKKVTAYLFYRILNSIADQPIPEDTGDFRLITRRVLQAFCSMPESHRFVRGMISWIGFKQVGIRYRRGPRAAGETGYPLGRMAHFALDAITSFSIRPLRAALYAGLLLSLVSIILFVVSLWAYFAHDTVRGWTSLASIILLFFAAQFLFLGLIGEYLGRLYMESKRRPLFIIDEVVSGGVKSTPGLTRVPGARDVANV
ncbi:MAG TPA: glycosyltransferase family 2 protein [Bryobacteraceae bacterium]|nr:glycosyltransferase family 2 protein [Bryobacteraceae bacterium]